MSQAALEKYPLLQAVSHWALGYEGSTRSSAVIRIGIVLLVWTRWAGELIFQFDTSFSGICLSLNFYLASLLMLLGYKTRLVTMWLAGVLFVMYYHYGVTTGAKPWGQHHTYLLTFLTFLSALTPAGKSYSLDRYLALRSKRKDVATVEWGNLFGLRLMALQLSALYFWTAFDKSDLAWLSGERLQFIFTWYYFSPEYPGWPYFPALMSAMACFVLVLEYTLVFGLFIQRWQKFLIPMGIFLHLSFYVFLVVKTFSLSCILMYLAFVPAKTVHDFLESKR